MHKTILLALTILASPAFASQSGVAFQHKDWEIACDNTLTCRIAGYAEEEATGSLLITRAAGANIMPTGEVTLADTDEETKPVKQLTLWINGKSAGGLTAVNDNWQLSESQTLSLIKAVKGSGKVEFRGGPTPFLLSGDGAYAVMLKADDVQGRIGTPGALTKKGDKPESSVARAIPAPVIQAAKVSGGEPRPLTTAEIATLKSRLLATVNHNDGMCDSLFSTEESVDADSDRLMLTPLNDRHVLLSALCWRAAYNEGYGYWVIDSNLQGKPVLVTDSGSYYDKGEIELSQKGRGIGDCWGSSSWVWDGKAFRQSSEATTGMCRYIHAGGTWDLPVLVTEVKPAS